MLWKKKHRILDKKIFCLQKKNSKLQPCKGGFNSGPWTNKKYHGRREDEAGAWHVSLSPLSAKCTRRRSRCLGRTPCRSLWPFLRFAVPTLGVFIGISLRFTVSCKLEKCRLWITVYITILRHGLWTTHSHMKLFQPASFFSPFQLHADCMLRTKCRGCI